MERYPVTGFLNSYKPTARERITNWMNQHMFGDTRQGQEKASRLMNVLDFTPLGVGTAMYDAGRQGAQGNYIGAGMNLAMAGIPGPGKIMRELPSRTADTMSDAIAIASPNGRMSGRAKNAAVKRLGEALFGPGGLQRGSVAQPTEVESLLRQAKNLRDLADRGMSVRKFTKEAEALEAKAAALMNQGQLNARRPKA